MRRGRNWRFSNCCQPGAAMTHIPPLDEGADAEVGAIRRGQTFEFALGDRQRQQRAPCRNEIAATFIPEAIGMNSWPLVCIRGPTSGRCLLQRWISAVNGLPVWIPISCQHSPRIQRRIRINHLRSASARSAESAVQFRLRALQTSIHLTTDYADFTDPKRSRSVLTRSRKTAKAEDQFTAEYAKNTEGDTVRSRSDSPAWSAYSAVKSEPF